MDLVLELKDQGWDEEDERVFVASGSASIASNLGNLTPGGLLFGSEEARSRSRLSSASRFTLVPPASTQMPSRPSGQSASL